MANCSNCQAPLKAGAKFCPECGAPVASAEPRCPECGESVQATAKFCPNCGHNLTQPAVEPEAPLAVETTDDAPEGRNWKAMALPLIVIPIFVLIGLLLTRGNQSLQEPGTSGGAESAATAAGDQGMSMEMMQKVRDQINDLIASLEANPQDTTAMLSLAQMYEIAGRFDTAAEYYAQYLKLHPNTPRIQIALANTHFRQGRYDDALAIVDGILKKDPKNQLALYNLGVLYAHTGKSEEAVKAWQKLIDLHPHSDAAHAAEEGIKQLKQVLAGTKEG